MLVNLGFGFFARGEYPAGETATRTVEYPNAIELRHSK
jgi:hypothetical protein